MAELFNACRDIHTYCLPANVMGVVAYIYIGGGMIFVMAVLHSTTPHVCSSYVCNTSAVTCRPRYGDSVCGADVPYVGIFRIIPSSESMTD